MLYTGNKTHWRTGEFSPGINSHLAYRSWTFWADVEVHGLLPRRVVSSLAPRDPQFSLRHVREKLLYNTCIDICIQWCSFDFLHKYVRNIECGIGSMQRHFSLRVFCGWGHRLILPIFEAMTCLQIETHLPCVHNNAVDSVGLRLRLNWACAANCWNVLH